MILATDVRAPSLFAEPRKIIDVDEATELLTAVLPDVDAVELRDRLSSRRGFALAQARDHAAAAAGNLSARIAGRRIPVREQARLSQQRRGVAPDRPRQHRQPGHRRNGALGRRPRARGAAHGGARHRSAATADLARGRSARAARAARRTHLRRQQIQGEGRRGPGCRRQHRRDHLDGVAAGLRSEQPEAGQRSAPHQPADHRRVRARLDLQGADAGDGARLRQGHAQLLVRRPRSAALRALHDPRLSRPAPRSHGAGDLHLFVEHRHRAHRAVARRRVPQVVPQEDGPARPAAHRIAGKRRAAGAQALGRDQHRDHRVRPWPVGRAVAGGRGDQRAGQRRLPDPADVHEAHQGKRRWRWRKSSSSPRPARRCAT